jgi:hypothetical protein
MIADVIRNPRFSYFFSFMLGVGLIVIILHKDCNSNSELCQRYKSPNLLEVKDSIYIIGSDCYKFKDVQVKCPVDNKNLVEPFNNASSVVYGRQDSLNLAEPFRVVENNPYGRSYSPNKIEPFEPLNYSHEQNENIIENFKGEFNSRNAN